MHTMQPQLSTQTAQSWLISTEVAGAHSNTLKCNVIHMSRMSDSVHLATKHYSWCSSAAWYASNCTDCTPGGCKVFVIRAAMDACHSFVMIFDDGPDILQRAQ